MTASGTGAAKHVVAAPGVLGVLVACMRLEPDAVAGLSARLPEERFVPWKRGGEAFDSLRWPLDLDASLALAAARALAPSRPELASVVADVMRAGLGAAELRVIARRLLARQLGASGADERTLRAAAPDATDADVRSLADPPWPAYELALCAALANACYAAADGLPAYDVQRTMARRSAEPAATVVAEALDRGAWDQSDVVAEAERLAALGAPLSASRESAVLELATAADLRAALLPSFAEIFPDAGERFAIPRSYAEFLDGRSAATGPPARSFWGLALHGARSAAEATRHFGDLYRGNTARARASGIWLAAASFRERDRVFVCCDRARDAAFGGVVAMQDDHPWLTGSLRLGWPSWDAFLDSAMVEAR